MVPNDWEIKKLDNVFKVFDSLHKTPTFSDDGFSMVRVTDIKGGYLDLNNTIKVSPEVFAEFTKKYKPKASDIVFSRVGSYGISSYVATNTPFCLGQNTVIAESNSSADPLYIFNVLKGQYVKRQVERTVDGSSHKTVSLKIIRNLAIPIPPLPEQRKIAKILSTWDKAISTTERLIDNSKQQKKALMQQLLTGKKRLLDDSGKPFEGEWIKAKLIDTASSDRHSFTGGPFGSDLKSSDYTSIGVRIIQLQNIGDGQFHDSYKIFTSKEKADKLLSCNIYPGEIIISKMGDPVARATIIPNHHDRYLMASDGIRLKVNEEKFDTNFIHEVINGPFFRKIALSKSTGSTRKRIGLTDLKNITFLSPELPEQQKIASVLTNADKEVQLLELQLADLKQEKKALMQQLLTGKRRVKVEDEVAA